MNLGALLEASYRAIHDEIVDGLCTSGGTNSITDTLIINKYTDAKFKNWVCFISDTGEYARVTGNVNATGVISFAATVGSVTAGDPYSVVKASVPLNTMVKLSNDAMTKIGRVWLQDTSGTTVVNTRNYTLGTALKGVDFRSVYLKDANNYYYDSPPYEVIPAAGGTAQATLAFRGEPSSGKTIVINYMGYHPALSVYNSAINEKLPDQLVISALVERAMHWKMMPKQRKIDVANWQDAAIAFEQALRAYRKQIPPKENRRIPITVYN